MAKLKGLSNNLNAFLDTIAVSEGTSTHPLTKNDGYDVIVTGIDDNGKPTPEIFTDYSQHPFANGRIPKKINSKGLFSSASGRYQHMRVHWVHYRDQLGLKDFGPESQDLWAIQLIRERKGLPLIEAGKFKEAIAAVCTLWASLPGATYVDQKAHSYEKILAIYLSKGGKLWESNLSSAQLLPQSPVLPQPSVSENTKVELPKPQIEPQPQQKPMQSGLLSLLMKLFKRN